MRCILLADVHSNLEAFQAVLQHARENGGFDEAWCLGDVVGYGPDPQECIRLLRQLPHACVAGNHDLAAAKKVDTDDFNPHAAAAAEWTAEQLTAEERRFLGGLPETLLRGEFTLVHGSPRSPVREYVLSAEAVAQNLLYFDTRVCLIGHSHVPVLYVCPDEDFCYAQAPGLDFPVDISEGRVMLNPGGLGQPRDGDPRAAYAILDPHELTVTYHRVTYDFVTTQAKMKRAGLPQVLASRLGLGR